MNEDDKYYENQLEDASLEDTDTGFPLDEVTSKNHKQMRKIETPDFGGALLTDSDIMGTDNQDILGGKGELLGSDLMSIKKRKGRKKNLTSYQSIFRL
tara:strand:+ start:3050 stop:3343 length:294 start_codon:yes stop_codon:yes gene_type:complete